MASRIISLVLGLVLMTSPALFDYSGTGADMAHIFGPVVTTFSFIALSEVTRNINRVNVLLGVWIAAAPIFFQYPSTGIIMLHVILGLIIAMLGLIPHSVPKTFGGGWDAIFKDNTLHQDEALKRKEQDRGRLVKEGGGDY